MKRKSSKMPIETITVYTDRCLTCGRYAGGVKKVKELAKQLGADYIEIRLNTAEEWDTYYKLVDLIGEKRNNETILPIMVREEEGEKVVEWLPFSR